jgi:hypothetical protein
MKVVVSALYFLFWSVVTVTSFANQNDPAPEAFRRLASDPPSGIDGSVWREAVTSQLSQCANGEGGDCKCTLVVAQGIQGDIASVTMWIGTYRWENNSLVPKTLWSGYGSRKASGDQNRTSVNMPTDRCKRRNGIGSEVSPGMVQIPGRRPRPTSTYINLMQELGLPQEYINQGIYTSFYFSTPMHNEMYKFHDFYPCSSPSCPATLGCLGLERLAMKDLCLRHMGSNGSNGFDEPEKGGVWLYFHNIGAPESRGSEGQAIEGTRSFMRGTCSSTSLAELGDGSTPITGSFAASGIGDSAMDYDGSSGNAVSSSMQAMQAFGNSGYQPPQAPEGAETPEEQEAYAAYTREVVDACQDTVSSSCPNLDSNVVRDYCADNEAYARDGECELRKLSDGEREYLDQHVQ